MTGTIYKIDFDFTSQAQKSLLAYLQTNGYKLLAYKGASGPMQVTSGLPTWFSRPFTNIFGQVEIDYQPQYKVYVYNKATIGADTTIQMQSISDLVGLGTTLVFNQDGSFTVGTGTVPADSIMLKNNTQSGTSSVTVGLAALIDGEYLPFCAFTSTPQGSLTMTPHDKVCLFAAQTGLVSGSVTANAAAPGCSFSFDSAHIEYDLAIAPSTYSIIGDPSGNGNPVSAVDSGDSLALLLNS